MSRRTLPNILVTGTPGTGKSTLCSELANRIAELEWINVGEVAKQHNCFQSYDKEYACPVLDEDRLLDEIEEQMNQPSGGRIVDYHGCDFFPRRWFDVVFVLRTDLRLLHDRLTARGYSGKKLEDNIQCEIFQTMLDEARESYDEDIVHALVSDTPSDMEVNIERICDWVETWRSEGQL